MNHPYAFYSALLRFVAARTERTDSSVAAMMAALSAAADQVDADATLSVAAPALKDTARAFAGIAGFLQKQILPEAVAAGNAVGTAQLRWAVDTSMDIVTILLHGLEHAEPQTVRVPLPPGPVV